MTVHYISINAVVLILLFIKESLKNLSLHKNMQQNIYWEANQYSNEAENASLFTAINYILKYIIIKKTVNLKCDYISEYSHFFNQINAALVSIKILS